MDTRKGLILSKYLGKYGMDQNQFDTSISEGDRAK
jgi:hypothetical protein